MMSVGEWEPEKSIVIDLEKLNALVAIAEQSDEQNLSGNLSGDFIKNEKGLMTQAAMVWQAAESLTDEQLTTLIRFFTLAEMQLPDWVGGKTSPVIYLVKMLRSRSSFDPELRRWIKTNTDNRFLPNGSAL